MSAGCFPVRTTAGGPHTGMKAFAANGKRIGIAKQAVLGEPAAMVWDLDANKTYRFTKHPTSEQLSNYALGRLPAAHIAAIVAHLERCEVCRRQADGTITLQRPGKVYLVIQVPLIATDVAQMTSDGEHFRMPGHAQVRIHFYAASAI